MATRKLVAQTNPKNNQILKMDSIQRFIVNDAPKWQFLFNAGSDLTNSVQIPKIAAEFDNSDRDSIRVIGYLYNTTSGTVDNASTCEFKIFRVATTLSPKWDDVPLYTVFGVQESNSYFFSDIDLSDLPGADLDGDTTLMVEVLITRLGRTYRDRLYINHLGVYDSIIRLRQDVEWLDISKLDE